MTYNKKKNITVIVLSLLVLFLLFYSLKKTRDYSNLDTIFQEEKNELKNELSEIIKDYTDVVVRKKNLSKRLRIELKKMIDLRDSVKNINVKNYKLIGKYRRKIITLERQNRNLFAKVDSLNVLNDDLKQENIVVKEVLNQKKSINETLKKENRLLEEKQRILQAKVAGAGILKTGSIKVAAVKERSSGKLTITSKSRRTDAFKINFDLLENPFSEAGSKHVYIQIKDEDKNVVAPKGKMKLKNGSNVVYSDSIIVNYTNHKLSLLSLVLVNRDNINKGKYTVSTFVDGAFSGNTTLKLK
ncbi:hypothetical protein [Tenacibaculum maritimum]|uniref:Uncharacterized protein n=3 Tax=Tenacibaculum maritimum TaxID=107401 RepID=A0A2H1E5T5_9FLAO|nr:hypothetical protein [Tenacibaculum maritimum]MCD9562231.1 hypothetical protein [Tenacibaculum maritimum]MCD9564622.1 hypothetical protein [Tenacibaculum maritimum]MCD9578352.1 hypothetical protein [Tenacibaculum maritimum]MCD9584136.1 hypothetical protein [Tenacibaculum maritimum]MCD9595422.1 hypothetical protein [Tenacibaculum maritimum]